ncbi:unnamed protein product, partial [Pleuronectes platessa]
PGVRHTSTFFWGVRSSSAVPHGVSGAGAFFLLDRGVVSPAGAEGGPLEGTGYGGRRRRLWTRVGPFSRITSATAPAGGTLRSRGAPPGDGQRPCQGEREESSPIRPSAISPSPPAAPRSAARGQDIIHFRDSRYSGRARNPAKQHEADLTEDVHLLKDTSYVAGLPASLCDRL